MVPASFRDTLVSSAKALGHNADAFRSLNDAEVADVVASIKQTFGDAANGAMTEWWHSDRPCALPHLVRCFQDGGWRHLAAVAFDQKRPVWLIAENWKRGVPPILGFASTASIVQDVLGNTHGFEYIVVDQGLTWLFAEDHEDCVSVAGAEAVRRLDAISG